LQATSFESLTFASKLLCSTLSIALRNVSRVSLPFCLLPSLSLSLRDSISLQALRLSLTLQSDLFSFSLLLPFVDETGPQVADSEHDDYQRNDDVKPILLRLLRCGLSEVAVG
jgi:hypothetical protein